jgi:hypothetical protein
MTPGRKPYQPTKAQRKTVELWRGCGLSEQAMADSLGITRVTLRKHFKVELATGAGRARAENLARLKKAAEGGSVAAIKYLDAKLIIAPSDFTAASIVAPEPQKPKLGKKEQAVIDAANPDTETMMGDLMAQRAGLLTN